MLYHITSMQFLLQSLRLLWLSPKGTFMGLSGQDSNPWPTMIQHPGELNTQLHRLLRTVLSIYRLRIRTFPFVNTKTGKSPLYFRPLVLCSPEKNHEKNLVQIIGRCKKIPFLLRLFLICNSRIYRYRYRTGS